MCDVIKLILIYYNENIRYIVVQNYYGHSKKGIILQSTGDNGRTRVSSGVSELCYKTIKDINIRDNNTSDPLFCLHGSMVDLGTECNELLFMPEASTYNDHEMKSRFRE